MNPTQEFRAYQTARGINEILAQNAEIGGTVLWMGGMDIGPILDDAVERERVRASVEFARRIMDMQRVIASLKERVATLEKSLDKCHVRELKEAENIRVLRKLLKSVQGLLGSCGIEGDMWNGIETLKTRYHSMLIGSEP
jgi:hypothetical protein